MAVWMKRGDNRQGAIVRCGRKSCRRPLVRLDEAHYKLWAWVTPNELFCTACRGRAVVTEVYGRYVMDLKCGSKCTGAYGPACDCSCGGENHGRNYAL